ncbi:uncharacterized protein TRIADDRAFT_23653, partial [Trichoplax adhaerens]
SPTSEIMKFGFPSYENIKSRNDYVLSYNRMHRTANWVIEHLTSDKLRQRNADRSESIFTEDLSVPEMFRSTNKDYSKSGFDRGHLAAARNHAHSQDALKDTFYLSNMSPQVGEGFNRGIWNRLEQQVRSLTKVYPDVYVITGPLYLPLVENDGKKYVKYQVIGKNNVSVPTHFFKIVVGDRRKEKNDAKLELQVFLIPNRSIPDDTPLHAFMVPLESVEKASGLTFLDKISRSAIKQGRLTT